MLRPIQWSKNVFVFAPLVFSRHLFDLVYLERAVAAFAAFSLVSSVVYIVNDIADRSSDRLHPLKRMRPIASGEVSIGQAIAVAVMLLAIAGAGAHWLGLKVVFIVSLYLLLNLGYSLGLKQVILVDVFIVASGFMLRVLAGAFAIGVLVSPWLVLCTLFVSVFLAVSKRRAEILLNIEQETDHARPVLRHYDIQFIEQMMTVTAAGMAISYALYTVAERTVEVFGTENLIFTTVFVLFGIFRYLYLMRARKTDDNPTHLLMSDVPTLLNMAAWLLACVAIIYSRELRTILGWS
jgi:4-hydroxybenzoate polyprenyltransferase